MSLLKSQYNRNKRHSNQHTFINVTQIDRKNGRSGFDEIDEGRFCFVLIDEGSTGGKVIDSSVLARGLGSIMSETEFRLSIRVIFGQCFVKCTDKRCCRAGSDLLGLAEMIRYYCRKL